MFAVYKIVNLVTGDCYAGHTVNLKRRKYQHFWHLRNNRHHSSHLQRAFNKYGEDAFCFEVVAEFSDEDQAIRLEQELIDAVGSYNQSPSAKSTLGSKRSQAFKERQREIFMGRALSDSTRAKISDALTGHTQSLATREKRNAKLKGQKRSEETRQKLAEVNTIHENLSAFGREQSLKKWCEEYGVTYSVIHKRVFRSGWDLEKALTTPPCRGRRSDLETSTSV